MKTLFSLSLQQISRRKGQALLLGLSMLLGSALLSGGLGLLWGLHKPFDRVFDQLQGGHFLLYVHRASDDPNQIRTWFAKQKEVHSISQERPSLLQNGPFLKAEDKLEMSLRLTEYQRKASEPDQLKIMEGENRNSPGIGEIWIPVSLAKNQNLHVGDSLGIPVASGVFWAKISATVIDPHYASGMVNPGLVWLSPGSLAGLYSLESLQTCTISIRLNSADQMGELWDRFIEEHVYQGSKLDYDLFRSAYGSLLGLMGSILVLVAFLVFTLSILLIHNSLSANIQADFRQIGIWKSLGFLPGEIQTSYLLQVCFLATISIGLGIGLGRIIFPLLLQNTLSNLGILQLLPSTTPFLIAAIGSFLLILSLAWKTSRKAVKVPAAQAIRFGQSEPKNQDHIFSFRRIKKAQIYFAGFLLQSRLWRNLLLIVSLAACMCAMSILLNMGNSFSALKDNPAAWGFEEVDLTLKKESNVLISRRHTEIMQLLSKEPALKGIVPYEWYSLSIFPQNDQPGQELLGKVYDQSLSSAGLLNLHGKHPQQANEIALCIGTATKYASGLGDSIRLRIEGQEQYLRVCGIYQDIGNMGQGFRLHSSAIKKENPLFEPSLYGLQVRLGEDIERLKGDLSRRYGEIFSFERSISEIVQDMGIISGVWALVQVLGIFFLLVMGILIVFDFGLIRREEEGHFRVLQAIGMNRPLLKESLQWRLGFVLLLSISLGILAGDMVGGLIISQISAGLGLPEFPYQAHVAYLVFLGVCCLGFGLGISQIQSRSIQSLHRK